MTIAITGAGGFLGKRIAHQLSMRGASLLLADIIPPSSPPPNAKLVVGNLADTLHQVITEETTYAVASVSRQGMSLLCGRAVVSLAAVVSSGAEADFPLGYKVNLTGLQAQLERCRELGTCPKFIFTSSLAVFGAVDIVNDSTGCTPQSSYGTQKVSNSPHSQHSC